MNKKSIPYLFYKNTSFTQQAYINSQNNDIINIKAKKNYMIVIDL
jgi:hypothetical protein